MVVGQPWHCEIEDQTETMDAAKRQEHEDILVPDPVQIKASIRKSRGGAQRFLDEFVDGLYSTYILSRTRTDDEMEIVLLGRRHRLDIDRQYRCYAHRI